MTEGWINGWVDERMDALMDGYMRRERKSLLVERWVLTFKCEGSAGVKSSFATIKVKIGLGKNHQWLQNLGGNFNQENISMILKCPPTDYLLEEGETSYLMGKKLTSTLTGWPKLTSPIRGRWTRDVSKCDALKRT